MKYGVKHRLVDTQRYIMEMRPVLRKSALFSDGTKEYRIPPEPNINEPVKVRFRTASNNIDTVWLVSCENRNEMEKPEMRMEMEKVETSGEFDYYEATIPLKEETIWYYFEIETGLLRCYYDRCGVSREARQEYYFNIKPGFSTPDWSKGAVIYQIFVDRFFKGDTNNDVETREYAYINDYVVKIDNWDKYPASMGVREFYGGDLQGVMDKLDYLQKLGVEVLYFNPLFVSPSNHKYDTQDYDYIDPHYGKIVEDGGCVLEQNDMNNNHASMYIQRTTNKKNLEASNAFFVELVEEIHRRGMRVILDGVFNHCGSFNKWMDRERIYEEQEGYEKGAYIAKDSPYGAFFAFHNKEVWPYNNTYDGWWGHDTLPKLNYEASDKLCEYMLEIARKWVSPPYNVDGWRLDVAADLGHSKEFNHQFWKDFRKAVKEANPEAIILAEHYGSPVDWLEGDQWDTVMNYDAFMEPITWFLTGMEKHSDSYKKELGGAIDNFISTMKHYTTCFFTPSLQCAMNELSNHDHSRFLTRTNGIVGRVDSVGAEMANQNVNKGILKEAVVMQMTWPGAPTIYYGDEVGLCGFTDPDNRRTYPWGNEDKELLEFHREIIHLHKSYQVFKTGSLKYLESAYNLLAYARFDKEEQFVMIINNNCDSISHKLSVWAAEIPRESILVQRMFTSQEGYSVAQVEYEIINGELEISMPKYSAVILQRKKDSNEIEKSEENVSV